MTTWAHLTADLHHLILSRLPLWDAIALLQAHPTCTARTHVRARVRALHPLRDAWVRAGGTALRSYANPSHLRTSQARAALPPSSFARLSVLPVSAAHLCSLDGIAEMPLLRVLDASNNHLRIVPSELASCRQLRVINLGSNALSSFPDVLFQLPELRTLLLQRNSISSLPEDWSPLANLYRLGLFDCSIRGPLPEQLCRLLGTRTDQRRRRSANLQRNSLDHTSLFALFTRFPLMASAIVF